VKRWIKSDLDAQDRSVPIRLSDLSGAFDQDPTGVDEREGVLTVGLGFRQGSPAMRPDVELRRCSGEFWTAAMSRR
jgi:hypothetical protein